jgi:hypothetical protein
MVPLGYLQWKRGAADRRSRVLVCPGTASGWTEAEINLALACQATGQMDRAQACSKRFAAEPNHAGALRAGYAVLNREPEQALDLHKQLIDQASQ